jgi:hypothetical protein
MAGYEKCVPSAPIDAQYARWINDFWDNVEVQAENDPRQWWIVIDHFNKVLLPQPTRDLIKEFTNRVNVTLENFRIVLIGYVEPFLPDVRPHVIEDETLYLGEKERNDALIDFFIRAFTQRNCPHTEDDVHDAVVAVVTQVNKIQPGYMSALSMATSLELHRRLDQWKSPQN